MPQTNDTPAKQQELDLIAHIEDLTKEANSVAKSGDPKALARVLKNSLVALQHVAEFSVELRDFAESLGERVADIESEGTQFTTEDAEVLKTWINAALQVMDGVFKILPDGEEKVATQALVDQGRALVAFIDENTLEDEGDEDEEGEEDKEADAS